MTQWFSADLHLGHANIIRYCNRPYGDVPAMNAGLIERWNSVVAPDDEVWVLGDVAMGKLLDNLPLVGRLHGRKLLLTGNHDRCWPGQHGDVVHHRDDDGKRAQWRQRYLDAGFAEIHDGDIEIELTGTTRLQRVRACHFPYEGDSQDRDRFPGARPDDDGRWILHGHVHDVWRQHGRMINVGVDAWGGQPVAADDVLDLIEAGERDLRPLPWPSLPAEVRRVG